MGWTILDSNGNTKTKASSTPSGLATNNTWTGSNTFNGEVDFGADVHLKSVISPSALSSGNNNNWNPTGLSTANAIRVTTNAANSTVTGIAAPGVAGQLLYIENIGSGNLLFTSEDTNSSAANRFNLSATLTYKSGDGVIIWYDTTSSRWRVADAPGGGGATADVFANRPAAGTAGKIYLPTDGYSIAEDNGTSWLPFGPVFAFTTPDDTTYSWVNQSTSTSGNQKDAAVLTSANASATDNLYLRVKTAPATPYTITAALLCYIPFVDFFGYGLCFRDSVSGKIVTNEITSNSSVSANDLALFSGKYNSATSFNATYTLTGSLQKTGGIGKGVTWMRIADDGVNRSWSLSMDSQNFTKIFSVSNSDFITANQVGYYIHSSNASFGNIPLTLLSWKQS